MESAAAAGPEYGGIRYKHSAKLGVVMCSLVPRLSPKTEGRAWYRFAHDIAVRHRCTINLKRYSREDRAVAAKYSEVRSLLLQVQLVFCCVDMLKL